MQSERIGELVMEGMRTLNGVAYVRFASVYRHFREARHFHTLIDELSQADPAEPPPPKPKLPTRA